jgi:hypothetical protein
VAAFDMIVAELPCPCGGVTPRDGSTDMQTSLRDEPDASYIGVGDPLPVSPVRARDAGYVVVRDPAPGEDAVLLHSWRCPGCGLPMQWAHVTVRDGVVVAIEPVALDAGTFARTHYAVDDVREVAAGLAGLPSISGLSDEQAVRELKARLR